MPRYERMPLHDESDRAPSGVCELSIQATTEQAFERGQALQKALSDYVEKGLDVKGFQYDESGEQDRVVVYTGTDRLDIATMRDIAEVYGQITEYEGGNIPPELSLVPTSREGGSGRYFAWLEFKLQMELPKDEVELQVGRRDSDVEITPKNPVGENLEAIVYRDGNMANHQVREIINKASKIRDAVPVDYIRLVCEPRR